MFKPFLKTVLSLFVFLVVAINGYALSLPRQEHQKPYQSPESLYKDLFFAVQSNDSIFSDSKTFVDCIPRYPVNMILEKYATLHDHHLARVLKPFIQQNFIIPNNQTSYRSDSTNINSHISLLWNVLTRQPDLRSAGTLIPLPYAYVVPGGRFREIYYWDSYFTMLGLKADHRYDLIQDMVDNFAWMIRTFGFVPNGNRTYYLSRSQPPFFSLMVELLASIKGDAVYVKYQKELMTEYAFWMKGADKLYDSMAVYRNVVRMPDGIILNRYWDSQTTPRPESFRQDVATANEAVRYDPSARKEEIYRNLRAGAESGWDFSSRWLIKINGQFPLYTIHATEIIPVDLNCLLYHLEITIAKTFEIDHNPQKAAYYLKKANERAKAVTTYCWNESKGFFFDYNFKTHHQTNVYSLAGVFPLFVKIASKQQADSVAKNIQSLFLYQGGLVTTTNFTSQQWDAPNGWAPLQWITIQGLRHYDDTTLANECKYRWLNENQLIYHKTFKMTEKYDVVHPSKPGGGGEYPGQDGFGWTNGVYQALSKEK
ncbi:MAG: alpha,alpha-trehalase TreF [Microbacter sp.]